MTGSSQCNMRANQIARGPVLQQLALVLVACHFLTPTLFLSSWVELSDSHVRLNAKHLSKLFKRFSAFVPQNRTQFPKGNHIAANTSSTSTAPSKLVESRRSNEFEVPILDPVNVTSSIHMSHGINVFLSPPNQTLSRLTTTTPSHQLFDTVSTVAPLSSTLRPTTEATDTSRVVTSPTDQCKCVCRNNFKLETYDIRLEELRMKLLQAELLSDNKSAQSTAKIEDVLDSLVDEDESDYDDADELEQIQKPTKYIPMEIIELSHRRPPRKPDSSGIGHSATATTTAPSVYLQHSTTEPSSSAPLYSVSFAKPASTIKFLATRVAQVGIPLLMTVALGNALTQIELIDRSSSEEAPLDNRANFSANPLNHWNLFQMPFATQAGYYGPFYDPTASMRFAQQTAVPKEGPVSKIKNKNKRSKNNTSTMWKRWLG